MELIYNEDLNQLKNINIKLEKIEKYLFNYKLFFNKKREVPYVENINSFPLFIETFYYFIEKGKIPKQKGFINQYLKIHKNHYAVKECLNSEFLKNGLIYRLEKTYPSLIRDLHFMVFLKENTNYDIFYNFQYDSKNDIDIGIKCDDEIFALCLHVGGRNSNRWRKKKENIHNRFSNVEYIEVTINEKDKKGEYIWLYGDNHLKLIEEKIKLRN